MTENTTSFSPGNIGVHNAEQVIASGIREMAANGDLIINLADTTTPNSLVACALIEWKQSAKRKKCKVIFSNANTPLQRILRLYHLQEILLKQPAEPDEPVV